MSPTDWTADEDRRMADYRGEGRFAADDDDAQDRAIDSEIAHMRAIPWMSEDMTTEELRHVAAHGRLFETPEEAARADRDDDSRDAAEEREEREERLNDDDR